MDKQKTKPFKEQHTTKAHCVILFSHFIYTTKFEGHKKRTATKKQKKGLKQKKKKTLNSTAVCTVLVVRLFSNNIVS